jgi:DNA-binding HxlR family transcriptional regulator
VPAELPAHEAAAARVGDRWTLLLVAALLDGPRRFGELQAALPGVATNILTTRLRQLEADGLAVATPYQERPPRFAYRLTDDGAALGDTLRLLAQWGAEHPRTGAADGPAGGEDGAAPWHHVACGTPVEARWWCRTCARVVDPDEASDLRWA